MLLLTSTSDKIQVVTGSAVAVDVHASFVDKDSSATPVITPSRANTAITTAATTDVVASPPANWQRNVQTLNIKNIHASSSNLITVIHTDGTTPVELIEYSLGPNETLQYVDGEGWRVINASGQIRTESAGGGGGSVTSNELSAAVAAETSNRISADNALSGAIAAVSNALSNEASVRAASDAILALMIDGVSDDLSIETVDRIAADNALSAAINTVSNAVSVETAARISADNALSNAISNEISARTARDNTLSAAINVVSNSLSVETAARISADNALSNAISNEGSVRAAADNVLSAAINTVSNTLSAHRATVNDHTDVSVNAPTSGQVLKWNSAAAQWVNSADATGGAGGSVTSNELSAAVAVETSNRISADNALSQAVSVAAAALSVRINTVSNAVSVETSARVAADNTLSAAINTVSNNLSAHIDSIDNHDDVSVNAPVSGQVLKWNSAAGQWVNSADATGGAGGSTNPTSNAFSVLNAHVLAGIGISAQYRSRRADVSISAAALTNIPSLSVSLEAGGAYIIEGVIIYDRLVSGTYGFGFSTPALAGALGSYMKMFGMSSQVQGGAAALTRGMMGFSAFAGQTVAFSTSAAAATETYQALEIRGFLNVSAAGVFQLMAKGSTAATVALIVRSAWIRALRIE